MLRNKISKKPGSVLGFNVFRLINTAHRGKGDDIWVVTLPFVPLLPLRSLDFSIQYPSAAVLRATPELLASNLVKSG